MSDRLAAKIKDNAGKQKYSSLNLNQTYKGNKVEIKTSSGATRHGLQSLGKIGSSRRIPPPANLPSLKSENSGNDPTVSLVPSGGGGWGSTKDKPESTSQSSTPPPPQTNAVVIQQPSLQPQRPTGPLSFPSSQPPAQQVPPQQNSAPIRQETATTKQEKNEAHAKTWGSVSQSEAGGQGKPYSHQPTPYFNREFPTLGFQDNGEGKENGKENYGPPVVIRNTHEPPWMERSGPGPPSHSYRGSDNVSGGQRRPMDFQNARNTQHPPQHYGNNYRQQHGYQNYDNHERPAHQRPGQGPRQGQAPQDKRQDHARDKPAIRPTVLRPEDIQAMDDEDDDGGWAGAHGEVDYTAKLNFEDFDEEDKEKAMHKDDNREKRSRPDRLPEREKVKDPIVLKRPMGNDRPKQPKSAWGELPQRPQQFIEGDRHARQDNQRQESESRGAWNKQYPPPSQNRATQPDQYQHASEHAPQEREQPASRNQSTEAPPLTRKEGEDSDEWTARRQKQHDEMHAAAERARRRREQEELDLQAKAKAAAMMKLKAIEGKNPDKNDSSEKEAWTDHLDSDSRVSQSDLDLEREKTDKVVDHGLPSTDQKVAQLRPDDLPRRRTDSDSSDASRSSGSRQFYHQQRTIPPRFQQQRQQQQQQYQQQQLYQATHGAVVHSRDVGEPSRPLQTTDTGPISPSGKMSRPGEGVPVKRIMKRTDSTSTTGDDVASVKSLESGGDKDRSSKLTPTEQEPNKPIIKHKSKDSVASTKLEDKARKPESRAESKHTDKEEKPLNRSEKTSEDKEEHAGKVSTSPRKREYQTSDRKTEEPHKRKRDEFEDSRWDDKRNRPYKDRQLDGHSRGRPTSSIRGRGRGITRGRQDHRSGSLDNRQRYTRDSKPRDYRDNRREFTDKHERFPRESKSTEDQKDTKSKAPTEVNNDQVNQKKDEKSDSENQDQKVYPKERSSNKEPQDKDKGERRTEKYDRRNDKYDRRDDRDQRTRPKSYDSRRENRDDSRRDFAKSKDDTRQNTSKDHRDDPRRNKFPSRGQRDDEQVPSHNASNEKDKPSDQTSQSKDENKVRDTDTFKGKPREEYDRRNRDYDNYRDRNRRDHHPGRQERGGHRGQYSMRGRGRSTVRGAHRGSGRLVGSGRIVASNIKKKEEEFSSDEEDGSGSESSSYTTATSASEERPEEKEEKPIEHRRSTSQSSNTTRTVRPTRGTRGRGGSYLRSRPQQEKPPRFQKQQERAAQQKNFSRAGQRGNRDSVRGVGRGRGRGRGRTLPSSRDEEGKSTQIEATEDWEDDVDNTPKDHPKDEKPSRRGGFSRSSSDRGSNRRLPPKDDSGKSSSRQQNAQSRGESFLGEKQVKGDGSKLVNGEPRGSLPAGKNTDPTTKKNTGTPKDDKRTDYSALDSIDGKVPKRNESAKKANIELFDLHNVAGVICIDDIPDDASDISSSGFVEVTSKRTQKELKEKQREEDERKKRIEEKTSHLSSDMKYKKNQNKPPRFSKQHQNSNQSKSFDGKLPGNVSLENTGLVTGGVGSNSSSTNSTKRNSPVTVERSLSPQGPVFNAWNKPLTLVTPAKAPGTAMVVTSNVPDPLAVGSGKPSRQTQPSNVVAIQNSLIDSNIEDTSAEDELKEMTKEIESMAPTEEQEEVNSVSKVNKKSTINATTGRDKSHDGNKKTQPKPQREKPPRFEKTAKRKNTNDENSKKDFHKGEETKKVKDISPKDKESKEPVQGKSTQEKKFDDIETEKQKEDTAVKTGKLVDDDTTEKANEEDTIAPRKDSDYSVDSESHGSGDSSMFSSRPLSVDITDSSSETQERPSTPVSPAYEEMSKRMFAARKAWEEAPTSSVGLTAVSSAWSEASASKETGSRAEVASEDASESRESVEVAVSKSDIAKPSDTQFSSKKPGGNEQQNVCKVKPQQQAVKPQHAPEDRQQDLDTVIPSQPVMAQEHLLPHNIHSSYPFQLDPQLLQLQRQTAPHFIQPVQSLQQSATVATNRYQIQAQLQQIPHQPTSAPSPLSQSPQELFQSPYLASNLYSASGFSGSQPFVSIPMVATTTTPSYSTSSTRTQAISIQQPKTATSSMFGQPGPQAQTVYMPFDPQSISGTATLLNFSQQSQAQRPLIGGVGFTDVLTQQPHLAQGSHHQAPQQFQRPFAFPAKPAYNEADHSAAMKQVDQSQNNYSHQQSEMVKHINAKPFEPPKRLSTPTSLSTSSGGNVGMMPSGVNPNVVHIRPNPPNIGALSQSPPMQTSYISNSPVSMSPVDPNVPFPAGANSFAKHAPIGHFQVTQQQQQQSPVQQFTPFQQQPVHIKPQQLQHHQHIRMQHGQPSNAQQHGPGAIAAAGAPGIPPQALLQRQYGAVGTVGPQHQINNQRFPGPIQRPPPSGVMPNMPQNVMQHQPRPQMQQQRPIRQQGPHPRMPHNVQKPPLLSTRPPMPPQIQAGLQQNPVQHQFKALQHQKMLEETRMFFAAQDQQAKMKVQQQSSDTVNVNQQQMQKPPQPPQQTVMKQVHASIKPGQDPKIAPQNSRQPMPPKQSPIAPLSGAHHHNKPPRMTQDKSKQSNQEKKDKKEENKSHIIELPRKKPQDSGKLKQGKPETAKSDDTSQMARPDGKAPINKRGNQIRIAPMMQKPPPAGGRGNRTNKPRQPFNKNMSQNAQSNKPKAETTSSSASRAATGTSSSTPAVPAKTADAPVPKGNSLEESSPKEAKEVKPALTTAS